MQPTYDFGWEFKYGTIVGSTMNHLGKVVAIPTYYTLTMQPTRNQNDRLNLNEAVNEMWEWCSITFGDQRDFDGEVVWTHNWSPNISFIFREEANLTLFVLRYKGT